MSDLTTTEREPLVIRAAVTTAVTAVVHVAVLLGVLPIDESAETAIGAAVDAAGLVVLLIWTRPSVTANAKVIARVTNDGKVVAGDASVAPTGMELGVDPGSGQPGDPPALLPVGIKPERATDTIPH